MLRHLGAKRTYRHNVQLASLLCMAAGFVNAAGFLGFATLTTNVTGHAAFFAARVALSDWSHAWEIGLWMLLFLAGAFLSGLVISLIGRHRQFSYGVPLLFEAVILLVVGLEGYRYDQTKVSQEIFAGSLLFAMGLQNALVSMISGSVVRTTHLTGTFTDLGIDLAQFIDPRTKAKAAIRSRILLRSVIICFFMTGALLGAWLFRPLQFSVFFVPVGLLLFALLYDVLRVKVKRAFRRWRGAAPSDEKSKNKLPKGSVRERTGYRKSEETK